MQMHRDQRQMLKNQADIREQIGKLKGERAGFERLSADVLETIHNVLSRHEAKPNRYVDNYKNSTSNLPRDLRHERGRMQHDDF